MAKPATKSTEIEVVSLRNGEATFCILGTSPLIMNRMAEKARQELLMPRGRLTTAQRATHLKHDPLAEYRSSVYRRSNLENAATRLIFPAPAFKGALAEAAKDMPTSVAKAQINRLTWVVGQSVDIYGTPKMLMSVVRSADMNKTPDIRTRAILEEWCTRVTIRFVEPMLSAATVGTLLAAAGVIDGVGDFRQGKGKGNHGQFILVADDDPDFQRIMRSGGAAVQDAALEDPEFHDIDTEDLYHWFCDEYERRGQDKKRTKGVREGAAV